MGALWHLDVAAVVSRYGTQDFVETGTGAGDSLRHALKFPFRKLYSVEIMATQAAKLQQDFAGEPRVEIHAGRSTDFLAELLPRLDAPVLFWLDAHYPGGDLGLNSFDQEADLGVRLPLRAELEIIQAHRPTGLDVLLIDDLRIYEDGPYAGGTMREAGTPHLAAPEGLGWVEELFHPTHTVVRSFADTGYLFLYPNSN